jgi:EAL and modified HD-GYP domain-containing signal transduction protein
MPEPYWFASILIDAAGHWSGRFLRAVDTRSPRFSDPLPAEFRDCGEAAHEAIFLAGNGPSPCERGIIGVDWLSPTQPSDPGPAAAGLAFSCREFAAAGRDALSAVPASRPWIVLDSATALAANAPKGSLIDVGHLLYRSPARSGSKVAATRVLSLLSLLAREADTRELETVFRAEPELTYHLLRLVNSVGHGLQQPISSLAHAITVLGRRQLKRWLQLLLYANLDDRRGAANPLLQLAAYRGDLLECLLPASDDTPYMVGIFSLLDRLLPMSMADIVNHLPLGQPARAALAARSGALGQLLSALDAADTGQIGDAASRLAAAGIAPAHWHEGQSQAYRFAAGLGVEP